MEILILKAIIKKVSVFYSSIMAFIPESLMELMLP
jgi:hypothetical protein